MPVIIRHILLKTLKNWKNRDGNCKSLILESVRGSNQEPKLSINRQIKAKVRAENGVKTAGLLW